MNYLVRAMSAAVGFTLLGMMFWQAAEPAFESRPRTFS